MTDFFNDIDKRETEEWLDALQGVLDTDDAQRANFIIKKLQDKLSRTGADYQYTSNTPYTNSIPVALQDEFKGDLEIEDTLRSVIRWNAMAMVVRANRFSSELGGHIATYASAATLYETGFNHFWRAPSSEHPGDLIYYQGHASPGMYSRSFLEGRFDADRLDNFRQDISHAGNSLTSYPHPWIMPDYWQFPTVSMGLGPIMSIYQARFLKYLNERGIADTSQQKVWAFLGDGEIDEPESLGAISMGVREKLDNLVFVVNCNLQRLDGPVRGNSKIIQELERVFRGAGWNTHKVIWGEEWDELLAKDKDGMLLKLMEETVDGEYQNCKANGGAYTREKFFGKYPETAELVKDMTDDEIWNLKRGGHDTKKVFAAYSKAHNNSNGRPTVILAKTVKGFGLGSAVEAQNPSHQQKKLTTETLDHIRGRFNLPISDKDVEDANYYTLPEDSKEMKYLHARRKELGGSLPQRRAESETLKVPALDSFKAMLDGSGDREISTTMAFVRILTQLTRDKEIGKRIVPIVPDEARTFGMEGMFRQLGIYSSEGQLYEPVDKDQVMYYKESKSGQVLEEGINEAGAISSWVAAATAYSTVGKAMIPFYIYYSMFGFQRIGDQCWLAGDIRARGFLVGGTAGRTTLAGEGLQHQDGHGLVQAGLIPNCLSYDPTFSYEMAVIIQNGIERMYQNDESVFYYITAMNENYAHPAMPKAKGTAEAILKGLYKFKTPKKADKKLHVQLTGSGTIFREVIAAAELLEKDYGVTSDIWGAPSFNELARDARTIERENLLNPTKKAKVPYVSECFDSIDAPVIAATDYIRSYVDQIRGYINNDLVVLGTDGFGRSDTRKELRDFFEVNRYYIVVAALKALVDKGELPKTKLSDAIKKYKIDTTKTAPWYA